MRKINNIRKNEIIHGFKVKKRHQIKKQAMVYYELEHIRTGAKYVHLETADKENTFCVAFKTLPQDSTGVAHILEHTVLMGSKKYPVRDPFFAMMKRSLNTFMNAFTSSDWTAYPFSTQNKKDFYNLLSVYLDAVFFPELSELSFMQEGWRYELDGNELKYKGVVFNEMKGAMSSADRVMEASIMKTLYPNSTYRFNSGGDPKAIPDLTYGRLKAFHQRFYHPSNARFYTYGSFPLKRHLAFIDSEILDKFSKIDPKASIEQEPEWKKEKKALFRYPINPSEPKDKRYQACMSWLLVPAKKSYELLILEVIEYVLIGSQAAPLRKALIDSGLGSDLSDGTGFDGENRNTMFGAGLKDIGRKDAARVKKIIFAVLEDLAEKGIEPKLIKAAVQKQEFSKREKTNVPYPHGLSLFLRIIGNWLHGGDPEEVIKYESNLKKLRADLKKKGFLERKIKSYFIDNKNRALIILEPDDKMQASDELAEKNRLKVKKKSLNKEDIKDIRRKSELLKERQTKKDNVDILPTLELGDVSPGLSSAKASGYPGHKNIYLFKQKTNGLFYSTISFDVNDLPDELLPLVPFLCYVLPKIGTRKRDYEEFSNELELVSGGAMLSSDAQTRQDSAGKPASFVLFNSKSLERHISRMLGLIAELFTDYSFQNKKRLKDLLYSYLAGFESDIVQNGHQYAALLASRGFSRALRISENWHGISQYSAMRQYATGKKGHDIDSLSAGLAALAKQVFRQETAKFALIGEAGALKKGIVPVLNISSSLASGNHGKKNEKKFIPEVYREGRVLASAVSFSACVFKALPLTHKDSPVLAVISRILTLSYLIPELREKRGAYGGFAKFNPQERIFGMGSYRDPHIHSTINIFDQAFDYIRKEKFSAADVKEAILSIVSEIDKPDSPAEAGRNSFRRELIALKDKDREEFKKRLLRLSPKDVRRVALKYFNKKGADLSLVILGSEQKLKKANRDLRSRKLDIKKIV